jgi:DNA-binding transcriptional ArsR family regulator
MPASSKSAELFAALGDQTRLRIVARLADGPLSIAKLTAGSTISRQGVTKHLRVLERARVVHGARHGREVLWQLDRRRLEEARGYLDQISRQWDRALARLRDFVED